jgi:prepilin-type N-terminal cleavage/methylation domain-containing protein
VAAVSARAAASGADRGTRQSTRRGEAGFTLIELAVATAVLLLAVMLACDLLDESGRMLQHSVRRAQDPWTVLAGELLRNDLRGAAPPMGDRFRCLHVALGLMTSDGLVVWSRSDDGKLVRTAGGTEHAYLQNVRSFCWRTPGGGAVEVHVRYHVSSPYLSQLKGSLPRSDPGKDEDLNVLVVARGGGMADQW